MSAFAGSRRLKPAAWISADILQYELVVRTHTGVIPRKHKDLRKTDVGARRNGASEPTLRAVVKACGPLDEAAKFRVLGFAEALGVTQNGEPGIYRERGIEVL